MRKDWSRGGIEKRRVECKEWEKKNLGEREEAQVEKRRWREWARNSFTDVGFPSSWQTAQNMEFGEWLRELLTMYCGCVCLLISFVTPGICSFSKKQNVPLCSRLSSHLPCCLPERLVMRRERREAKRCQKGNSSSSPAFKPTKSCHSDALFFPKKRWCYAKWH